MKTYLDYYADWYPTTYNLKRYPTKSNRIYTGRERTILLKKLSKKQLALVNKHKKYMMRSMFISKHFLEDTEWEFVGFNTDHNYDRSTKQYSLYCECGKALKYQFVVQSKRTKRKVKLGITHFSDHLKVSPQIANEIKKGVGKIDIALDELLWLKERGYQFPEDLWKRYSLAHYRNNTLSEPVKLNRKLASRIIEFRECNMPIFISDYYALYNQIKEVNKIALFGQESTFIKNKQVFENYYDDLATNQKNELYDTEIFLAKNVSKELLHNPKASKVAVDQYIEDLFALLAKRENDKKLDKKEIYRSLSNNVEYKVLNDTVLDELIQAFNKYGMSDNFYLTVPKSLRNTFEKYKVNQLQENHNIEESAKIDSLIENRNSVIKELLDKILNNQRQEIVENELQLSEDVVAVILETMEQIHPTTQKQKIIKETEKPDYDKYLNEEFIESLINVLFTKANVNEEKLIDLTMNLFEKYGFDNWPLIYNLLEARYKLEQGESFEDAFKTIPKELKYSIFYMLHKDIGIELKK